ncbi:GNAT family N-acetyltransferase [Sedimenticola sp.]|uniref:GNAT family N-acetyltransferase n=1 Tax=Sedimenticola sp. TaxID=1940285 RepID=UPI003D110978
MKTREIHEMNIRNLTALWKTMGAVRIADGLYRSPGWPYRLWLESGYGKKGIKRLLEQVLISDSDCIFPLWQENESDTMQLEAGLAQAGFRELFTQTAMFLELDATLPEYRNSETNDVITDEASIRAWVRVNECAFGYEIDTEVIQRMARHPDVALFLHRLNGKPVAAAMLFFHENMAGVHQMGVLPECRRQGVAKVVMKELIRHARAKGGRYCTLQASPSGYGLYKGLGFSESSTFSSFHRPRSSTTIMEAAPVSLLSLD